MKLARDCVKYVHHRPATSLNRILGLSRAARDQLASGRPKKTSDSVGVVVSSHGMPVPLARLFVRPGVRRPF